MSKRRERVFVHPGCPIRMTGILFMIEAKSVSVFYLKAVFLTMPLGTSI